jgi:transketolase C-terminal domain/subunit
MKSTRDGFGDQLLEDGINENIIVLGADLASPTKTNLFKERFRFINL